MHPDHAVAGGIGRRQQDVEILWQLCRYQRAAARDLWQADVGLGRTDVALLRAAVVPLERGDCAAQVGEGRNPRDIKVLLAQEIVERFHSRKDADEALADFEARFRQGAIPGDIEQVAIDCGQEGMPIGQVLKLAGLTPSTSEAYGWMEKNFPIAL